MLLSDNAILVLTEIYKQYLEKEDLDLPNARRFDENFINTCDVFGKPKPNTTSDALYELEKANLIKIFIIGEFELNPEGIAFMDEKYRKNLNKVKDFIKQAVLGHIS